ncbi:hypothetical protein OSCI_3030007 [Kamptonema sp. PCC 6506]|nr:hypothetical protein OSCI_3030007 [Kamptonema sp. PCC 6506]
MEIGYLLVIGMALKLIANTGTKDCWRKLTDWDCFAAIAMTENTARND